MRKNLFICLLICLGISGWFYFVEVPANKTNAISIINVKTVPVQSINSDDSAMSDISGFQIDLGIKKKRIYSGVNSATDRELERTEEKIVPNQKKSISDDSTAERGQESKWCSGKKWVPRAKKIKACTKIIKSSSPNSTSVAVAHCNRGTAYLSKSKPTKMDIGHAIADFNQAVRLDTRRDRSLVCRGHGYLSLGKYDRAITEYGKAISSNPKSKEAFTARGITYRLKGDAQRAISDFYSAIRIDSNYALAYQHRGQIFASQKYYDRAIKDFKRVLDIDPRNSPVFHSRCKAYIYIKNYARAITDCSKAIELNPDNTHAKVDRGTAYGLNNQFELSIADFTQAIKVDPKLRIAYLKRAYIFKLKGNVALAIKDLDMARELSRN